LSAYTLSRPLQATDGALLTLSSPTTLLGVNNSSAVTNTAIGFTWTFNGTAYTTLPRISSQGFIRLDSTTNLTNNTAMDAASAAVILAPWWDDMVTSPAPASGGVFLELQGSAPTRKLVIEWRCDASFSNLWTAYTERIKFQVVLYESGGKVEFRYGTYAAIAGVAYGTPGSSASCGVKVSTSVSQPGNIRDFFGTSGTPAGSTGPFLTNLTIYGGGIRWPSRSDNTTGLGAYNLHFQIVPTDPTYDWTGLGLAVGTSGYDAAYSIDVTVGANTATWTPTASDARDAMRLFGLWLHNASRPWYPQIWQLAMVRDTTTGGAKLAVTCDAVWTWEASGSNPLGIPTTAPTQALTMTATSAAEGTWSPASEIMVRGRYGGPRDGDAANGLAVTPRIPGTMHQTPQIEAVATPLEVARLSGCLALATNPRRGQLYDSTGARYVIAIGEVDRSAAGRAYYRLRLSAAIEV
tara:strand:- start:7930 stop:9324 length:1395 start_codon:yes stop_codon:yes gene_type:complete